MFFRLKSITKSFFIGLFLLGAFVGIQSAPAKKAQNQQPASAQAGQLPITIKNRLDILFRLPEVQEAIAQLYNAQSLDELEVARQLLMVQGFTFLDEDKYHIFCHASFPQYVFKIALPMANRTEELNASRITYAHQLRAAIKRLNLKIIVPHKWAFQFPKNPYIARSLPAMMVVAQKLDLSNATPTLTPELIDHMCMLEQETGFSDWSSKDTTCKFGGNVMRCGEYAVVVDTEPQSEATIAALHASKLYKILYPEPTMIDRVFDYAQAGEDRVRGMIANFWHQPGTPEVPQNA